jgi:hypothetical protein
VGSAARGNRAEIEIAIDAVRVPGAELAIREARVARAAFRRRLAVATYTSAVAEIDTR